jgi:hypothetical protein
MRSWFGHNRWAVAATLFPVLADAVHWLFFDRLNALWLGLLATPGLPALAVLSLTDLVWLVSLVYVGRLVAPPRAGFPWARFAFFYPSVGFALVLLMAIVQSAQGVDAWLDAAIGIAFCLFIAHLLVAAVDVKPRYTSGTPAHLLALVAVVLVGEVVLNLSAALFVHSFGPDPADAAAVAAAAAEHTSGEFLLAALLFVPFFAGPRFTFLSREFSWPALASGVAFVLWELHGLLGAVAL